MFSSPVYIVGGAPSPPRKCASCPICYPSRSGSDATTQGAQQSSSLVKVVESCVNEVHPRHMVNAQELLDKIAQIERSLNSARELSESAKRNHDKMCSPEAKSRDELQTHPMPKSPRTTKSATEALDILDGEAKGLLPVAAPASTWDRSLPAAKNAPPSVTAGPVASKVTTIDRTALSATFSNPAPTPQIETTSASLSTNSISSNAQLTNCLPSSSKVDAPSCLPPGSSRDCISDVPMMVSPLIAASSTALMQSSNAERSCETRQSAAFFRHLEKSNTENVVAPSESQTPQGCGDLATARAPLKSKSTDTMGRAACSTSHATQTQPTFMPLSVNSGSQTTRSADESSDCDSAMTTHRGGKGLSARGRPGAAPAKPNSSTDNASQGTQAEVVCVTHATQTQTTLRQPQPQLQVALKISPPSTSLATTNSDGCGDDGWHTTDFEGMSVPHTDIIDNSSKRSVILSDEFHQWEWNSEALIAAAFVEKSTIFATTLKQRIQTEFENALRGKMERWKSSCHEIMIQYFGVAEKAFVDHMVTTITIPYRSAPTRSSSASSASSGRVTIPVRTSPQLPTVQLFDAHVEALTNSPPPSPSPAVSPTPFHSQLTMSHPPRQEVSTAVRKMRPPKKLLLPPWNASTSLTDEGTRSRLHRSSSSSARSYAAIHTSPSTAAYSPTPSLMQPTCAFLESTTIRFQVNYLRHCASRTSSPQSSRQCQDRVCSDLGLH